MFKIVSAAVVAASLFAGPVLAQTTPSAPATVAGQPAAKAVVGKTDGKAKIATAKSVKHVRHAKHVRHHVRVVKHVNHGKQVKQPIKSNTAG
jgi:hypothetical protein